MRKWSSKERVALVNRGGKGFHGGSKRAKRRRARKMAKEEARDHRSI